MKVFAYKNNPYLFSVFFFKSKLNYIVMYTNLNRAIITKLEHRYVTPNKHHNLEGLDESLKIE